MKHRLIGFFLILTMMISLTACAGKPSAQADVNNVTEEQRKNVKETDKETGETYYLLGDFENYFEASQVKYTASFGTVTQIAKSEEPDMVTYGEQSLKLEILGTETTWHMRSPSMRFSTNNGFFHETTDFSDMSKFTFDIYNGQDYEVSIRFYMNPEINPRSTMDDRVVIDDNYEYNILNIITLEPNSWNHVEIQAEEIKRLMYDTEGNPYHEIGEEALTAVGGFHILFDRGELHENTQVYYIDNVRAYLRNVDG